MAGTAASPGNGKGALALQHHAAPNADQVARDETAHKQQLFAWADALLQRMGIDKIVAAAQSTDELNGIKLDPKHPDILSAIHVALHEGKRLDHFVGYSDGALKHIIENRFNNLKHQQREKLKKARRGKPDWTESLKLNDKGKIMPIFANLSLMLQEAPAWKGVLGHNQFDGQVVIKKHPPIDAVAGADWTDYAEWQVRKWFQIKDINPTIGDVGRAVHDAARRHSFHPVRDYLNEQNWDGTPRLQSVLQTYFGADDTEYMRAIGPRWLIQAVARIFEPGCQADYILVLEGPQGMQKTAALRTIAVNPKWYTGRISPIGSKDAVLEMAGVWIIEDAEMTTLNRASSEASKQFVTDRVDRIRPPYGKYAIAYRRSCVFAATTNLTEYLKDPTGARRYWPFACHGTIDCAGLERDRNQLWAEAVHLYKEGHPRYLQTPELEALATAEQELRRVVDAWETSIRKWAGVRLDIGSLENVIKGALKIAPEKQTQPIQKRVKAILTHMGFRNRRPRTGPGKGDRERRYQRDPAVDAPRAPGAAPGQEPQRHHAHHPERKTPRRKTPSKRRRKK